MFNPSIVRASGYSSLTLDSKQFLDALLLFEKMELKVCCFLDIGERAVLNCANRTSAMKSVSGD